MVAAEPGIECRFILLTAVFVLETLKPSSVLLLGDMWKAQECFKPRSLPGDNILMPKLYQGFRSDDFAD